MARQVDSSSRGKWNGGRWTNTRRAGYGSRGYANHDARRFHTQTAQMTEMETALKPPQEDLRHTLQSMVKTLESLSKRIDSIERGPDRVPDRPTSGPPKQAGPHYYTKSSNDDFASVVRGLYRMVQLRHHEANWAKLPKALNDRLNSFAEDINPPMPDERFRATIKTITREYGDRICEAVRQHMSGKRQETEMTAATKDPADLDRAKEIAGRQLAKKLGRRLDDDKRHEMLDVAATVVGRSRGGPQIDEDGFVTVVGSRSRTPKKPLASTELTVETPRSKRARESSTPTTDTVPVCNRFDCLQDLEPQVMEQEVIGVAGDDDAIVAAAVSAAASTSSATVDAEEAATVSPDDCDVVATQPAAATRDVVGRSRTMRPSVPVMTTAAGVRVFNGRDKDQWRIVPADSTRVLVVGDSNLRATPSVPTGWEVHCLPGGKIKHMNAVLEDVLSSPGMLSAVYVQAGINHRDSRPVSYAKDLERLTELNTVSSSVKVVFVGVSKPSSLGESERRNIDSLNDTMTASYLDYISPLPDDHVKIAPGDSYGIHHTPATVAKIFEKMREHSQSVLSLN